jgi:hypothetical protein
MSPVYPVLECCIFCVCYHYFLTLIPLWSRYNIYASIVLEHFLCSVLFWNVVSLVCVILTSGMCPLRGSVQHVLFTML